MTFEQVQAGRSGSLILTLLSRRATPAQPPFIRSTSLATLEKTTNSFRRPHLTLLTNNRDGVAASFTILRYNASSRNRAQHGPYRERVSEKNRGLIVPAPG